MNKKIITLIIAVVVIAIAGVGFWTISSKLKNNESETNNTNTNNSAKSNKLNDDDKVAIIYFSATGTTKKVAGYIKDATNGDLIEIVPKDKYSKADLNYSNNDCRANKEQNDSSSRPKISNSINTDDYDVIYLGYPIWWGDAPRIILTFLDSHDLSGKTVIPFCTSGGSGIGPSVSYFKNNYKDVKWLEGKKLSTSENEVINWVNELDY